MSSDEVLRWFARGGCVLLGAWWWGQGKKGHAEAQRRKVVGAGLGCWMGRGVRAGRRGAGGGIGGAEG